MKKILIIDDDTQFNKILSEKIKGAGMEAVISISGKEALEYVSKNEVDFIVLDFVMPEMDGDEFYRKLTHDLRKNVPTVVLTNFPALKPAENLEVYIKSDTNIDDFVKHIKERLDKIWSLKIT